MRTDDRDAAYAVADEKSKPYTLTISSTTAYLDVPPGHYDCWVEGGSASDHVRWAYLEWTTPGSPPTLAAVDFPAPTAATQGTGTPRRLAPGVPTAALGAAMAPANSMLRIYVPENMRVPVLLSSAGPASMHAVRVL